MDIILDFSFINSFFEEGFYFLSRQFFILLFFLAIVFFIVRIIWYHWTHYVQDKYLSAQKYVLLSIDVPRDNEQGPESIERFFAHLSGIKSKKTWMERNIQGQTQLDVSLEIVSQNGQISFFIHTPAQYRDLIEASIYAIYPGVEISESKDYLEEIPEEFPGQDYDLWGADLGLYNKNPYPIRTYSNFEHILTKELKDPMSGLLEILGKLQKNEQAFLQFIVRPIGSELKKQGESPLKEMTGTGEASKNWFEKIPLLLVKAIQSLTDSILAVFGFIVPTEEESVKEKKIFLSGEKKVIEAIQNKISKLAFNTRIRVIYLAQKNVFIKDKGAIGILSAFNVVNTLDMNGISTEKKVFDSIHRPYKSAASKKAIIKAYKKRKRFWQIESKGLMRILKKIAKFLTINVGPKKKKTFLNTEELATLYHLPMVKESRALLIKKTGSKKGEPPFSLPVK